MRIVKTASLAVVVLFCLVGSSWADSVVTPSMYQSALQTVVTDINQNYSLYQSSSIAKTDFVAGEFAGINALFLNAAGNSKGAQINFQTAIADFNQVLKVLGKPAIYAGPSYSAPDAGSLALLGCSGIALFGALKRKYSK